MSRERLRELLRIRAACLAVPDEVVDRALARCARIEARERFTASGRQLGVDTPAPASPLNGPTVPSLGEAAPPASGPTVQSLGDLEVQAPPVRGALESGRIVAGYRIESLLGKGGMGSVYRATQLSMNRQVAFKVLAPRFAGDPTFVGRFKREARAAGRLHHPNLITVHDWGEADGMVFFSMELVEGHSLKDLLKEHGQLPVERVLQTGRQVLEALQYAHAQGVVHRDIKPDNIMVCDSGRVKIADLGLSRIEERHAGDTTELFQTGAGSFMGTPHYMPPEQGRDAHTADRRSDLYSLGATMYHLACGKPPFGGTTPMEVLVAAQTQPLTWPEAAPPKPFRELIARLMEKEPDHRPADAAAAIALIDRVLHPQAAQHRPGLSWWQVLKRLVLWSIALSLIAGLVIVAVHLNREQTSDRAWNAELAAAEALVAGQRYDEAIERLMRIRSGFADGSPRAEACDASLETLTRAWDTWALGKLADTERLFREAMRSGRFSEALDLLKKVPAAWKSPAGERRLDALQATWEAEAARRAEQPPPGQAASEHQPMFEEWKRGRDRTAAELWARAGFTPEANVAMQDGAAVFQRDGHGRLPLPQGLGVGGVELRCAWSNAALAPEARWDIRLGRNLRLSLSPVGATLEGLPGGPQLLCPADGGSLGLRLRRIGQGLAIERSGGSRPVWIPEVDPELTVDWKLGSAALAVTVRPKGR